MDRLLARWTAPCAVMAVFLGLAGASDAQQLSVERVASGLANPIFATSPAGDTSRLFLAEQGAQGTATIEILNLADNTINPTPFLTLSGIATGGEQGLLGMAFDPNYATNGRFYVDYTAADGSDHIDRFTVSGDSNIASASGVNVLTIPEPQANHNGGWIGFSPRAGDEGNLYIAVGDGGNANDQGPGHVEPGGNAQNTGVLLGKILRINVSSPGPLPTDPQYAIPASNPFGNEVFVYGLRNPFRDSFDPVTGNLLIGDVGQGQREEIDSQLAGIGPLGGIANGGGENFGWRLREGTIATPGVGGSAPGLTAPLFDYDHSVGRTIIGGYVYRGSDIPSLDGTYIFGDYLGGNGATQGRIFAVKMDGSSTVAFNPATADITAQLFPSGGFMFQNVYSFGEDARGEVYILDGPGGAVYKIVPEPSAYLLFAVGGLGLAIRRKFRRPSALRRVRD
ncbi:MAG TPA: PQQ-dependent sugar dehydrogenase [Pirellulales bacterium]|jgi:hypothetical protein